MVLLFYQPCLLIFDPKLYAILVWFKGMTEACSSLTFMTLHDPTQESYKATYPSINQPKQGTCVGKPAPHIELMVKLDESSSKVGKILTRGSHTMLGYWGHQLVQANVATSESSSNEAWLDTGDIGAFDEFGNLWLIGRSSGCIKTGGENVYPEEVSFQHKNHVDISLKFCASLHISNPLLCAGRNCSVKASWDCLCSSHRRH